MKDRNIRELLRKTELQSYINDPHSKVVEELKLPVAKARIDIAVINGHLHGFEIKSASDTLHRLPSQIVAYSKVFDYLTVVTEAKYYDRIELPEWVGLAVCSDKPGESEFEMLTPPLLNTNINGFYLAQLLWHSELVEVLQEQNILFKKQQRNWLLCEKLADNLDVSVLSMLVREQIKKRQAWKLLKEANN